jgi:hypothetical protein
MFRLGEHAAQQRVDHGVKHQVVNPRHAGKQPRVPQEHVVQFVHDEHQ